MSQKNDYPIHCPQCQHAFSQALYDAVTLAEEPEAKQALLGNTLNRVLCPECQHDFRIDKALLYNDAANGLLIYWMPATGDQVDAVINQFDDMMQAMAEITPDGVTPPSVQLVLERTELIERIFLHDAELDPATIEYIKHLLYSRNLEQIPPDQKALLFDTSQTDDEKLVFVVQDIATKQLQGMLEFPTEAYTTLLDSLHDGDEEGAKNVVKELFPGPYISARALLLSEED